MRITQYNLLAQCYVRSAIFTHSPGPSLKCSRAPRDPNVTRAGCRPRTLTRRPSPSRWKNRSDAPRRARRARLGRPRGAGDGPVRRFLGPWPPRAATPGPGSAAPNSPQTRRTDMASSSSRTVSSSSPSATSSSTTSCSVDPSAAPPPPPWTPPPPAKPRTIPSRSMTREEPSLALRRPSRCPREIPSGALPVLVASAHLFWDPAHADVKSAQARRLLEEAADFLRTAHPEATTDTPVIRRGL